MTNFERIMKEMTLQTFIEIIDYNAFSEVCVDNPFVEIIVNRLDDEYAKGEEIQNWLEQDTENEDHEYTQRIDKEINKLVENNGFRCCANCHYGTFPKPSEQCDKCYFVGENYITPSEWKEEK